MVKRKFKVGDFVSLDFNEGAQWLETYINTKNKAFKVLKIQKWDNTPGYCIKLSDFSHSTYFDPTWFKLANSYIIKERLGVK